MYYNEKRVVHKRDANFNYVVSPKAESELKFRHESEGISNVPTPVTNYIPIKQSGQIDHKNIKSRDLIHNYELVTPMKRAVNTRNYDTLNLK